MGGRFEFQSKFEMGNYDGFVKEIPFIAIDRFDFYRTPMPKLYFLTHCHKDHIEGLDNYKFRNKLTENDVYIYTSPITANVIKKDFPDIQSQLKEITVDKCVIITYTDDQDEEKHLQVSAISAGHCPGSVMFFFENEQNILCTGDFRINPSELHKCKVFHTASGQLKQIDVIYLDSTFFSEEYSHFPTRQESCDALCDTVKTWLNESPTNTVYLELSATYSAEFLLIALAQTLNEQIHVQETKTLYAAIPELDGIISHKAGTYRIHSGWYFNSKFSCCKLPTSTRVIRLSAQRWKNYVPNSTPILYDNKIYICVSFHSSYSEIKEFLRYLKPKDVRLGVEPYNHDAKETMLSLLESIMREIRDETAPKLERKAKKFKRNDSFELKDSSGDDWSPVKKKRNVDDLLSSP